MAFNLPSKYSSEKEEKSKLPPRLPLLL